MSKPSGATSFFLYVGFLLLMLMGACAWEARTAIAILVAQPDRSRCAPAGSR